MTFANIARSYDGIQQYSLKRTLKVNIYFNILFLLPFLVSSYVTFFKVSHYNAYNIDPKLLDLFNAVNQKQRLIKISLYLPYSIPRMIYFLIFVWYGSNYCCNVKTIKLF